MDETVSTPWLEIFTGLYCSIPFVIIAVVLFISPKVRLPRLDYCRNCGSMIIALAYTPENAKHIRSDLVSCGDEHPDKIAEWKD